MEQHASLHGYWSVVTPIRVQLVVRVPRVYGAGDGSFRVIERHAALDASSRPMQSARPVGAAVQTSCHENIIKGRSHTLRLAGRVACMKKKEGTKQPQQ